MPNKQKTPVSIIFTHLWTKYRAALLVFWIVFPTFHITINILLRNEIISTDDVLHPGIWEGATYSPSIFLLIIGIVMTPIHLTTIVSSGLTRKDFVHAVIRLGLLLALVSSLISTIGFPIEQVIYNYNHNYSDLNHPSLFLHFIEQFLRQMGYFGSGLLIGGVFYRFRWFIGILLCVLVYGPTFLIERLLLQKVQSGVLIAVLFMVGTLLLVLNYYLLRKVRIRRKLI